MLLTARAQAQPNIALVKYWGKRDAALNLPASGSLSVTLDALWTRTRVTFDPAFPADALVLNGTACPARLPRIGACLDLVRAQAGSALRARVDTENNFPTAAGLASSASGFAALVLAAGSALGLALAPRELSILARRASGSAARSIFGGYVEMAAGSAPDGSDAYAAPLLAAQEWPLQVVVAVTSTAAKAIESGRGMEISRQTSPFYAAWLAGADADLVAARTAVCTRDFGALAAVAERSCRKMHAVMLAGDPALMYWNGATVECMRAVRALRERDGVDVFFTVDAGPQLKAVCTPAAAPRVAQTLERIPGVKQVLVSGLGGPARLLPDVAP